MFDIDYISMHYLHQHNLPSTQHLNNKSAIPESELFYSIEKFGVNVEYKHKYLSLSLQKTNLFVCLFSNFAQHFLSLLPSFYSSPSTVRTEGALA